MSKYKLITETQKVLEQVYAVAANYQLHPYFFPQLAIGQQEESLLVIPDERDVIWLKLDGRASLGLLARCSAVQFTIDIWPEEVIGVINNLARQLPLWLESYPQDKAWKEYIKSSLAGYEIDRYGGPLYFSSLEDYCEKLSRYKVVTPNGLVDPGQVPDINLGLYIRSIWWYFRLRRYDRKLCLEIRPLPRLSDSELSRQLSRVFSEADPDALFIRASQRYLENP